MEETTRKYEYRSIIRTLLFINLALRYGTTQLRSEDEGSSLSTAGRGKAKLCLKTKQRPRKLSYSTEATVVRVKELLDVLLRTVRYVLLGREHDTQKLQVRHAHFGTVCWYVSHLTVDNVPTSALHFKQIRVVKPNEIETSCPGFRLSSRGHQNFSKAFVRTVL